MPEITDNERELLAKIVSGQGGTVSARDSEYALLYAIAELLIPA